jgi:hypothetical protein
MYHVLEYIVDYAYLHHHLIFSVASLLPDRHHFLLILHLPVIRDLNHSHKCHTLNPDAHQFVHYSVKQLVDIVI